LTGLKETSFREHGWVRIPSAFGAADAAAMCDVIWTALSRVGIHRGDPSTWTTARPEHLQHLKSDPVFQAIGSERTFAAIEQALEGPALGKTARLGSLLPPIPHRS
jgi:hypothetical protein